MVHLTVSVTQFDVDQLRWSLVTLVAFVLFALLSSVIAVFPKFNQGYYMLRNKYRYLRFSYACFLIGFVAAAIELTITVIAD